MSGEIERSTFTIVVERLVIFAAFLCVFINKEFIKEVQLRPLNAIAGYSFKGLLYAITALFACMFMPTYIEIFVPFVLIGVYVNNYINGRDFQAVDKFN
jgi:hypothetical protein